MNLSRKQLLFTEKLHAVSTIIKKMNLPFKNKDDLDALKEKIKLINQMKKERSHKIIGKHGFHYDGRSFLNQLHKPLKIQVKNFLRKVYLLQKKSREGMNQLGV